MGTFIDNNEKYEIFRRHIHPHLHIRVAGWDVKYGSMLKPETPDCEGTQYFRATYCLPDDAVSKTRSMEIYFPCS